MTRHIAFPGAVRDASCNGEGLASAAAAGADLFGGAGAGVAETTGEAVLGTTDVVTGVGGAA